jgi:hypothetical protein
MIIYTNIEEEFVDLKEETINLVAKSISLIHGEELDEKRIGTFLTNVQSFMIRRTIALPSQARRMGRGRAKWPLELLPCW